MKNTLTVLALLLTFGFAGCTKDHPAPKYTKAWLHDADGAILTFRNASTGATESLVASLADVTNTRQGKFDIRAYEYQTITLTYTGQQDPQAGLRIVFDGDGQVTFQPPLGGSQTQVVLETSRKSRKEIMLGGDNSRARLETDLELDGRRYPRLAHGEFVSAAGTLREFWYAKDAGLVAYTKTNGQTWYRVW